MNTGSFGEDVIELQNGCMCCTMADELFTSVAQLLSVNELRGNPPYDHILIESSGVSEPRSVRDNWQDAEAMGMALMDKGEKEALKMLRKKLKSDCNTDWAAVYSR
jgi:G3E family GTPase